MTHLYLATDGHEMCLWEAKELGDQHPRCVQRQSDVDPIVWSLVVGNLRVQIPKEGVHP